MLKIATRALPATSKRCLMSTLTLPAMKFDYGIFFDL